MARRSSSRPTTTPSPSATPRAGSGATGDCPANPAELLSSSNLGQLLRQVRADYDYILVDSPPLLAVSDPCIISPHVDGMLLVVRVMKNNRAALQQTRKALDTHGIRLYGVVANDLNRNKSGDGSVAYSEYYHTGSPSPDVHSPSLPREPLQIGN